MNLSIKKPTGKKNIARRQKPLFENTKYRDGTLEHPIPMSIEEQDDSKENLFSSDSEDESIQQKTEPAQKYKCQIP